MTDLLQPLPRPPRLEAHEDVPLPPLLRVEVLPRPTRAHVARRLAIWGRIAARFYLRNLGGRLIGRASLTDRARRLAEAMAAEGGTALTLGRLLASRADLLPAAHCAALATLNDSLPPTAVPAGATPSRCTPTSSRWWTPAPGGGRLLHEHVPEGAPDDFAADLVAIRVVLFSTEWLNVLPLGFADAMEEDLRQHLAAELDLTAQARYGRVLRKQLDDEGPRGLLVAVGEGDERQLVRLDPSTRELTDVPPEHRRDVARAVRELGWWTLSHGIIQHAPRPGDLGLTDDLRLVVRRFTDAGPVDGRLRRHHRELLRRIGRGDTSGAADVVMQLLSPIPFVDVHALQRRLEERLARAQLALLDPAATGTDRTTAVLWAAVLDAAREHGVPVRHGLFRLMRCALAHEQLALTLDPTPNTLRAFARWERKDRRRAARRWGDRLDDLSRTDARAALVAGVGDAVERLERLAFFVDALTSHPPVQYLSLTGKAAYAVNTLLGAATLGLTLTLFVGALMATSHAASGHPFDLLSAMLQALRHPMMLGALALIVYLALRRVQIRLSDIDGA